MKKIISLLLALVVLLTPIISLAADYTAMTNEELLSELNNIRVELLKRELNPENIILESDGLIIYLNGELQEEKRYDGKSVLLVNIIVVNNSDKQLHGSIDKISVNGWEIENYNSIIVDAGKKAKETFKFPGIYEDTDITSLSDINEIEFYGATTNPETYMFITNGLRKTILFNK